MTENIQAVKNRMLVFAATGLILSAPEDVGPLLKYIDSLEVEIKQLKEKK